MPPYMPENVVLQTGNGQNLLSWNIALGATSYAVQRSLDGVNWTSLGAPSTNYYIDTSCIVGTAYFYQVASVNVSGASAFTGSYPYSITPCLPGQINLGYIRYLSQLRSDKLNSEYLTLDEWNVNINLSIDALYDFLVLQYGENYFLAPPLIVNLTGADYYPLPDGSNYPINGVNSPAIYKLTGASVNIGGVTTGPNTGWTPLSRGNISDRDKYTTWPAQAGALNNVFQMFYAELGSNLWVFPACTNQVIRLLYVPVRYKLLLDTDMLTFSLSGWVEWVINDAAMKAMIKEESLTKWTALENANGVIKDRILGAAKNRDVGQPPTVSNTRATMGDPGFSNWGNGYGGGGFGGGGPGY